MQRCLQILKAFLDVTEPLCWSFFYRKARKGFQYILELHINGLGQP